jgi:hypothetical protein
MTEVIFEEPKMPSLSVIITSYTLERLRDIYDLLDSVRKQTYPNIEVIFARANSFKTFSKNGERLFKKPLFALRVILLGVMVLFFVGLGYFHFLPPSCG